MINSNHSISRSLEPSTRSSHSHHTDTHSFSSIIRGHYHAELYDSRSLRDSDGMYGEYLCGAGDRGFLAFAVAAVGCRAYVADAGALFVRLWRFGFTHGLMHRCQRKYAFWVPSDPEVLAALVNGVNCLACAYIMVRSGWRLFIGSAVDGDAVCPRGWELPMVSVQWYCRPHHLVPRNCVFYAIINAHGYSSVAVIVG